MLRVEELAVAQRPVDGLVKDLHIRQQRELSGFALQFLPESLNLPGELFHALRQLGAVSFGHVDSGRRNGTNSRDLLGKTFHGKAEHNESGEEDAHAICLRGGPLLSKANGTC